MIGDLDFEFVVCRLAKPGTGFQHMFWNGSEWEIEKDRMTDQWVIKVIDPRIADPLRTGTIKLTDIWAD